MALHVGVCDVDVVGDARVLCGGWVGMREVCRCRVMKEEEGCVREGSCGGRVVRCEVEDESVVHQVCMGVVSATGQLVKFLIIRMSCYLFDLFSTKSIYTY